MCPSRVLPPAMSRFLFHRLLRLSTIRFTPNYSTCRSHYSRASLRLSASSPDVPYHDYGYMEDDIERIYHYQPGGYHDISIGDVLNKRYRIVHKLGYGGYSTIWLARDEMTSKYAATKVATADSSDNETNILEYLRSRPGRGRDLICPLLDRFKLTGPNGVHPCLVTTPARCSLSSDEGYRWGLFNLQVSRSIIAQVILAVGYVHDLGYVHGGELN
jgi:serine/threonine-protein kinase SRPK3